MLRTSQRTFLSVSAQHRIPQVASAATQFIFPHRHFRQQRLNSSSSSSSSSIHAKTQQFHPYLLQRALLHSASLACQSRRSDSATTTNLSSSSSSPSSSYYHNPFFRNLWPFGTAAATPTSSTTTTPTNATVSATPPPTELTDDQIASTLADSVADILASQRAESGLPPPSTVAEIPEVNFIVNGMSEFLRLFHDTTGLPWVAVIFSTGILVRFLTFPIQLYLARLQAAMNGLEPILAVADMQAAKYEPTWKNRIYFLRLKMTQYSAHKCEPWRLIPPIIGQISIFIMLAMALRHLVHTSPDLAIGGFAWFLNLGAPDPTYIIPIAAIVTSYASGLFLEYKRNQEDKRIRAKTFGAIFNPSGPTVSATSTSSDAASTSTSVSTPTSVAPPRRMTQLALLGHYARGLTVIMIPLIVQLPVGVFFFWFAGTVWNQASGYVLRHPEMRKKWGLTYLEDYLIRRRDEEIARRASVSGSDRQVLRSIDQPIPGLKLVQSAPPTTETAPKLEGTAIVHTKRNKKSNKPTTAQTAATTTISTPAAATPTTNKSVEKTSE